MTKTINILFCITFLISSGSYAQFEPVFDKWGNLLIAEDGEKLHYDIPDKFFNKEENIVNFIYQQLGVSTLPELPDWYWADLGTAIGVGVLDVADLNGDGQTELITTGGGVYFSPPRQIFILANDLTTVVCSNDFNELPYDYKISQLDNDHALEILMVMEHRLISMDGRTCEFEVIQEFGQSVSSAAIGDVNNDSVLDIVYSLNNNVFISPWNNFGDTISRNGISGTKIIVNSLGREGGDDIGVLTDDILYILNGEDLTTIREIDDNLTSNFDFGDINGDGSYELIQASRIVSASSDTGITVTNIELDQVLYHVPVFDIDAMRVVDIDNDNNHEILVGEGQSGNVFVLNETGQKIIDIENPSHGTTNLIITNLLNGVDLEFIWGAGHSSSGSDYIYRADVTTETITWRNNDLDGPYQLGVVGDYLNTGTDYVTISHAESNSTYDIGGVSLHNPKTGVKHPNEYTVPTASWGKITAMASANIDQDPSWEICFTGDDTYDEFITCRDALTGVTEWSIDYPNEYIHQLKIMDIDDDTVLDLVAISQTGYINAYDARTGAVKWQSPQIPNNFIQWGFNGINLVDNELWINFISGDFYKLNVENGLILESTINTPITNIVINNEIIYAIKKEVGVGLFNKTTMDLDTVIYPTDELLDFLKISEDGINLLAAKRVLENQYDAILISVDNTFEPWNINTLIYDAYMPNFLQLILATVNGAQSYNLRILHDHIYDNGFEQSVNVINNSLN